MSSSLTPRLSTSKRWTNLPADLVAKIRDIFVIQFTVEARGGEFLVEGRIYPSELVIRVGFLEEGRLKQINFEASIDLPAKELLKPAAANDDLEGETKTMERLFVAIDALGSAMEEYFELEDAEEGVAIPLSWHEFDFEGDRVFMRHSTVNSSLEAEADRLLGLADDRLVQGEEAAAEDALANAEIDAELAKAVHKAIRDGEYTPRAAIDTGEEELQ